MKIILSLLLALYFLCACTGNRRDMHPSTQIGDSMEETILAHKRTEEPISIPVESDTIVDADYNFAQATTGTKAPQSIIEQLELFEVIYLSTDGKIHRGQILSNKMIGEQIRAIFQFMLEEKFVVEKAIPIVEYGWSDSLSMENNNSYSFCYRNISYSKHATGMAIDINPRFNPLRWKTQNRPNQPTGAVLDTTINGTLYPGHPVVEEFRRLGFRWGHSFTKFYDDHHFEKAHPSLSRFR